MFKVIIIEDEAQSAEVLKNMLREINATIEVVAICKTLPDGVISIKKHKPTLVFLDIELPQYSGLHILDFFDPQEVNFKIIFVTAYNKYAIEAFQISAVDYMLKPLEYEKLANAIHKVIKLEANAAQSASLAVLKNNLQDTAMKKIALPVQSGFEIVPVEDIYFIKAEGSYSKVEIKNVGSLTISKNLKYFEDTLQQFSCFFRVHRSYLVNIHFAKRIYKSDGIIILENDTEIPIISEKIEEVVNSINRR
ncbi:MAG: response regulator transcription factor [Bacteroidota bacterium]|nr:response regulator transcription factor [Bacteroidota bacterium]